MSGPDSCHFYDNLQALADLMPTTVYYDSADSLHGPGTDCTSASIETTPWPTTIINR